MGHSSRPASRQARRSRGSWSPPGRSPLRDDARRDAVRGVPLCSCVEADIARDLNRPPDQPSRIHKKGRPARPSTWPPHESRRPDGASSPRTPPMRRRPARHQEREQKDEEPRVGSLIIRLPLTAGAASQKFSGGRSGRPRELRRVGVGVIRLGATNAAVEVPDPKLLSRGERDHGAPRVGRGTRAAAVGPGARASPNRSAFELLASPSGSSTGKRRSYILLNTASASMNQN